MENINQQLPSPKQSIKEPTNSSSKYKITGIINILTGIIFIVIIPIFMYAIALFGYPPENIYWLKMSFSIIFGFVNLIIAIKLLKKKTLNKNLYFKLGLAAVLISTIIIFSQTIKPISHLLLVKQSYNSSAFLTPSPTNIPTPTVNISDISTWKTYIFTDTRGFGYTVKIPNNWENHYYTGEIIAKPEELGQNFRSPECERNTNDLIQIKHFKPKNAKSTVQSTIDDLRKNGFIYATSKIEDRILVEKLILIKRLNANSKNLTFSYAYIISTKGYYEISGIGSCIQDFENFFDHVLSNFKFTDQSSNSSQWQSVKIIDGSVYGINNLGKQQLLIDKRSFNQNNQYGDYNYGIAEAYLSPDKSKILLLFDGGITLYFLYYTNLDKIEAKDIGIAQEAAWSPNGRYIAYNSKPADAGDLVILKIYDTNLDKEVNISTNPNIKNLKYDYLGFYNIRWLEDNSGIKVKYRAYIGEQPHGEMVGEGEVNLLLEI